MQVVFMGWIGALLALQLTIVIDSKATLEGYGASDRQHTNSNDPHTSKELYIPSLLHTAF